MSVLPSDLQKVVADLDANIDSGEYYQHVVDVFTAIKDCIVTHKPIPQDLQDQYVLQLANDHSQDRYGK